MPKKNARGSNDLETLRLTLPSVAMDAIAAAQSLNLQMQEANEITMTRISIAPLPGAVINHLSEFDLTAAGPFIVPCPLCIRIVLKCDAFSKNMAHVAGLYFELWAK
ncbi:hypothetical protein PoB_002305400 [Plakobranchus ocellatus]|uniref:Uncharacterized protein n=1 Tax=Plakobranchus ocellatus TaxID=259542 RepID=A0AAV3ZRQ3_9GAST|nr:hypothetical protein PoB_002305400 [Plakobranchus ocellatus]